MALNVDLVSQFAKLTANKKETKKESTAWGEVVEVTSSGKCFVQLDGSDRVTPVDTITEAKVGDRVSVTITNHAATLTGNASSPSINADGSTVGGIKNDFNNLSADNLLIRDKLTASEGYIAELTAKNVKIEETLEAHTGKFENLEADVAEFERLSATFATFEQLTAKEAEFRNLLADYATIDILNANKAEINELLADKASIGDLSAIQGTIGSLDAGVADIKTLIFGTASGTSIHTNFANAVIAQLGDAQIKSAMIQDISAGKITSGEIITDKVKVKSNDGSLLISGSVMQIGDGTRVRIQIGKDASGAYSFAIFNANGDPLFYEDGITGNAIPDQIIKNNMVADDAAIDASKLDIDTLFDVINEDGSRTLKSTKVKLDEEGQTLDVAFGALTTKVDKQAETITSQGTAISVIQGNISSKIWQQDITTAINDISIGGANLIKNTKNPIDISYWTRGKVIKDDDLNENVFYMTNSTTTETTAGTHRIKVEAGEWYTVSALVKRTANVKNIDFFFLSRKESDTTDFVYIQNKTNMLPEAGEWVQLTWSFEMYSEAEEGYLRIDHNGSTDGSESILYYTNIKVEKGRKATDWSPAPEDVTILNTRYSTLNQTLNGITTTVGSHTIKINDLTKDVSDAWTSINQSKDAIELRATKTELEESYSKGRNLLRNTGGGGDIFMAYEGTSPAAKNIQSRNNTDGIFTLNASATNDEIYYRFMQVQSGIMHGLIPGETYTLAGKVKVATVSGAFSSIKIRNQYHIDGSSWLTGNESILKPIITDDSEEWVDFSASFKIPSDAKGYYVSFQLYYENDDIKVGSWSGTIQFKELKLEKGNKRTPWSVAPEDTTGVNENFKNYYTMSQTDSQIQLTSTGILQTVSETYATQNSLKSAISQIQQTSDSIKLSVEKISRTGRNLVQGTSQKDTEVGGYPTESSYDDGPFSGQTTIIPSGNDYVMSFEAKSTVNDDWIYCYFYSPNTTTWIESSQGRTGANADGACQIYLSTEWKRYWIRYTQDGSATTNIKRWIVGRRVRGGGSGIVSIRCVKLEAGHDPTPWSAAPEDARSNFANDSSDITITDGSITFNTGTLLINAGNFTLDANGNITATNAILEGTVNTIHNKQKATLTSGELTFYYDGEKQGLISSKYHPNASSYGLTLRIPSLYENSLTSLTFVHEVGSEGSGYVVDYQMHNFEDDGVSGSYDSAEIYARHAFWGGMRLYGGLFVSGQIYPTGMIYLRNQCAIGWYDADKEGPRQLLSFGSDNVFTVGSNSYFTDIHKLTIPNGASKGLFIKNADASIRLRILEVNSENKLNIGYGLYAKNDPAYKTEIYASNTMLFTLRGEGIVFETVSSSTNTAYFRPTSEKEDAEHCTLGTAANPFYRTYVMLAEMVVSDRRLKKDIQEMSDSHSSLFDRLVPVEYKLIHGDNRISYGLIAQDVLSAMAELGIEENELDLVSHTTSVNKYGELDDSYNIAYQNLIPMLIHEVQKLKQKLKQIEGE